MPDFSIAVTDLLCLTPAGLYCPAGDFYVDPWQPVRRAVITHAHADHLCRGCESYLVATEGEPVVRLRLSGSTTPSTIQPVPYGETVSINGVRVSLHPAGHILGSAQVRIEHKGQVWVVSGDYKTEPDATCAPFELLRCHVFITESTFGLPVYRWRPQREVFAEINAWWQENAARGRASVLFGYALGKAQRLLAGVDASIGLIFTHGAVERVNAIYRDSGIALPATDYAGAVTDKKRYRGALVVAPPSANGTPWLRKLGDVSTAMASGWMQIRGVRRRRAVDRGFVLSDHADWDELMRTIAATGAERVLLTHGYTASLARHLRERGLQADVLLTHFEGDSMDDIEVEPP
ncbi:MAG: DNA ligase-associated DEXH box helicase [Candidatus Roseilinea sp.]|nr:MAG: DNA ligase-associated DEXH box helicase [Candidatus Roseilinea sp.]